MRPLRKPTRTKNVLHFPRGSVCTAGWFSSNQRRGVFLHTSVGDSPLSSYQQRVHQRCRTWRSASEKSADAGKRFTISRSSSFRSPHDLRRPSQRGHRLPEFISHSTGHYVVVRLTNLLHAADQIILKLFRRFIAKPPRDISKRCGFARRNSCRAPDDQA